MYRCADETHTLLACAQREHKYSIWWHILILSSEVFELYFNSRYALHLLSQRCSGNTVSRQFQQLHINNLSVLSVCHILQNHIPNIKLASCLFTSKHGSNNSWALSSSFVVLLAKQPGCRVESWVSLAPGLYWCLLSRRLLQSRGMLLVYLAVHTTWWLISPLTFSSPSCNKHTKTRSNAIVLYCRRTVNDFSPPGHLGGARYVFFVCVCMCVFTPGLQ